MEDESPSDHKKGAFQGFPLERLIKDIQKVFKCPLWVVSGRLIESSAMTPHELHNRAAAK